MPKLVWDQLGEKQYETGVDRGVVFPFVDGAYATGEAWNGLTGVSESPSGAEPTPLYANNKKYLELMSDEQFGMTITAYTFPDGFAQCLGRKALATGLNLTQQERATFGMTYRTLIGNDTEKNAYGYKIHIVYGATAKPSQKDSKTVNESPEAIEMSWECSTTPVDVPGYKPTAHIEIDSTAIDPAKLKEIEDLLYGTESENSKLPTIEELIALMGTAG